MEALEQFHWRLTLILWGILLVGSMCLMGVVASNKTIIITENGQSRPVSDTEKPDFAVQRGALFLREEASEEGAFYIPVSKGGRAENLVVENCYMEEELRVYVKDADVAVYENQAVWGDISNILLAGWETRSDGVLLRLKMNGLYEYQSSMEGERLCIKACLPHELYRLIVVVDPEGGGSEVGQSTDGCLEKDIALAVSRQVQEQLKNEDIRLYFTRTEDKEVPMEKRCALAQGVDADVFINIGVSMDEDSGRYGIRGIYNENYFIPEFGNVQVADALTKNVTVACKNRAVGLKCAEQDSILQLLRIPAARVELGYLSNEAERTLLVREEYQKKLAEGIAAAIEEVYGNYYE